MEDLTTTHSARALAYEFKAEFGELAYNKANRVIATEWVLRRHKEMSMRHVDSARHTPITVELCLLPTQHAVRATELSRSAEFRGRRAAVDCVK
jgi:hypothetical protein